MEIKLFLNKDINSNANFYFEKAKKFKNKTCGVDKIIEKTKIDILNFENKSTIYLEKKIKDEKLKNIKKKEWYEKFRYSFTSSGYLIVMGKDAGSNEILIKKHTTKDDMIFHTQAPASPFGIVVGGKDKLLKEEIIEVAQIIVSFSSQWKRGFGTADAFWVLSDQVSKKAESGEYMSRGSFMIRGKKNIIKNIILQICVGIKTTIIETDDGPVNYEELFSGSENACKTYCKKRYLKLEPGTDNYKKLTKEIKKKLKASLVDLPKFIPNNCKILKR